MFDDIDFVAGAIGLILGAVIAIVVIGITPCKDKDTVLEKYKIEIQYKYNQINVVEE